MIVALVAGIVGGAIWGGLVGFLKAKTGAHEVITTIMLNYVAFYSSATCSVDGFQKPASNQATRARSTRSARLPHLFGLRHGSLIIAMLAAVGCWWLLTRSTLGFRLRAVGATRSPRGRRA